MRQFHSRCTRVRNHDSVIDNSMTMHHNKQHRRCLTRVKGFTLVEAIVSAMIITLAVLGPLSVTSEASAQAKMTKDKFIATYLAQEAIELLRFQQDSVYLKCLSDTSSSCPLVGSEYNTEAAWRILKARIGTNSQGVSCFLVDNPAGCSYDFIDMTTNANGDPTKFASDQVQCNILGIENASGLYVCARRISGVGYTRTTFSRTVSVESLPTFSGSDQAYNDDLRITSTVTFRRLNGYTSQVKVVDFLHAK